MANTKHVLDPGTFCWSGDGHHSDFATRRITVLRHHRVVRSEVAYRFYRAKQIYLGFTRRLFSANSAVLAEFHLERTSM